MYLHLGGSKGPASADLEQWAVEPTLSDTVCKYFEPLAGLRYNNLSGDLSGPAGRTGTARTTGTILSSAPTWLFPSTTS